MPYPRLHDDGQVPVLDLHGARVQEALGMVSRLIQKATSKGRRSVKIIHGSSTSFEGTSSIKQALHQSLDDRRLSPHIIDAFRADGYLLLSLHTSAKHNPAPIQLFDVIA